MVDEQCSLVYGGLYIGADCESSGIHINMDSRFSVLYKKVGQEWQVIHLHQSVPNPEQLDGEYYPRTLTQRSRETIEHLTRLAQRDSLTGLINFNTLQSFYTDLDKHSVWMFVVDMDDFKAINDTHGHLAGNHVLKRVASLLTSTMRAQDLMRRLLARAAEVAGEEPAWTGISIGASPIHSGDCLKTAFKRADQALYQAKAAGKNQGCIL